MRCTRLANRSARWLGAVEGAGGQEQNVVGVNHAVACVHRAALDDGQDVALHTLTGHVGSSGSAVAPGDLVDLVEKYDSRGFDAAYCLARGRLVVDEPFCRLALKVLPRLGHGHAPARASGAEQAGHHVLQIHVHLLGALTGEYLKARELVFGNLHLDGAVVELPVVQLGAQLLARRATLGT